MPLLLSFLLMLVVLLVVVYCCEGSSWRRCSFGSACLLLLCFVSWLEALR